MSDPGNTDTGRLGTSAADVMNMQREQMAGLVRQAESLRAERDRLASLVEKLRPYLAHTRDCWYWKGHRPCRCGLVDLLTEMETG